MKTAAVAGMGKMGIVHASILNCLPDVKLVAVMDKVSSLSYYLYGMGIRAPLYQSLEEMIEEQGPDVVFVCTPSSANYAIARACIERGANVFVEKPLANNLTSAEKMMELIKNNNVKHSVGFMYAHISTFCRAREILAEGVIGQVRKIEASVFQGAVFSKQQAWPYRKETAGGGAVMSLGAHLIFLLHWLFSPVKCVKQVELTYSSGNEVEDGANIEMELEGGIEGKMEISWSVPLYDTMWTEISAQGSAGRLNVSSQEIEIQYGQENAIITHISELPDRAKFYLGGEGYYAQDENFVSCLGTDREPEVTWREGYQVQRALDAIYRSVETKEPVVL